MALAIFQQYLPVPMSEDVADGLIPHVCEVLDDHRRDQKNPAATKNRLRELIEDDINGFDFTEAELVEILDKLILLAAEDPMNGFRAYVNTLPPGPRKQYFARFFEHEGDDFLRRQTIKATSRAQAVLILHDKLQNAREAGEDAAPPPCTPQPGEDYGTFVADMFTNDTLWLE